MFIERSGLLETSRASVIEEKTLQIAVKNIARLLGDEISDEQPLLDSRLPDGSRVAAVFPPCSHRRDNSNHPEVRHQALHGRGTGPHRHIDPGGR